VQQCHHEVEWLARRRRRRKKKRIWRDGVLRFVLRLCVATGRIDYWNVLAELGTGERLLTWMTYAQIEPFGSAFDDARSASVAQVIANVFRDPKRRALPLKDFLLSPKAPRADRQTQAEKTQALKLWAMSLAGVAKLPVDAKPVKDGHF
jgi:hypothetical protein